MNNSLSLSKKTRGILLVVFLLILSGCIPEEAAQKTSLLEVSNENMNEEIQDPIVEEIVEHTAEPVVADSDHDGLNNEIEVGLGTNPFTIDSDSDGFSDETEVKSGHDPLKAFIPTSNSAEEEELYLNSKPIPVSVPVTEYKSDCDPNYSGCVPNVPYDLDCPDIVGPVRVLGTDHHKFDRDGDGTGCDRG